MPGATFHRRRCAPVIEKPVLARCPAFGHRSNPRLDQRGGLLPFDVLSAGLARKRRSLLAMTFLAI
jgi:hypothetical protein